MSKSRSAPMFLGDLRSVLFVVAMCLWGSAASAQNRYDRMAPIQQYLSDNSDAEIALALSAAPLSVSRDAEVLVLSRHGYEMARKGSNGFTCLVERSWGADFDDSEFWNPRIRSPLCFNASASRSVYPSYRMRTEWVLEGLSLPELRRRTRSAVAARVIASPDVGAMSYMLSKDAYLGDKVKGRWHPHLMFYLPRADAGVWGVSKDNPAVYGGPLLEEPITLFLVPVATWSDGSPQGNHDLAGDDNH